MNTKVRPAPAIQVAEQSPPKKPRVQPPLEEEKASTLTCQRTSHTHTQIWKWTLTQDAIAPCRVKDVFEMQECEGGKAGYGPDFYWLGRVPCRSVVLYGIVVGAQQYENRTLYSVDDGSGQIDCNLRHMSPQLLAANSPKKHKLSSPSKYRSDGKSSLVKGKALALSTPALPKPLAFVGDTVRVEGRVLNRHYTRIINVDKIVVCKNPTEEPTHFLAVAELHKSYYNPSQPELFVIPKPTIRITQSQAPAYASSTSAYPKDGVPIRQTPDPSSPSKASTASSAPSTPSSSAGDAADLKTRSPPRLRHPSRLHSRDLTANTFRIYLRHYMDNVPQEPLCQRSRGQSAAPDSDQDDSDDDDLAKLRAWLGEEHGTPTKQKSRSNSQKLTDMTPRPKRLDVVSYQTPRAANADAKHHMDSAGSTILGFTLSHLRRVPELALLARRVVEAEYKRRAREERKKQKEAVEAQTSFRTHSSHRQPSRLAASSSYSTTATASTSRAVGTASEPKAAKIKRLFRYAIRQLYDEGSIVLWDGPVRALPLPLIPAPSFSSLLSTTAKLPTLGAEGTNNLWKLSSGTTRTESSSASYGSSVSQAGREDDEDNGELSDPPEDEDAYIPLTPAYLCKVVEGAITAIQARPPPRAPDGRKTAGPAPGPTPDEIVNHLHRRDERWLRVGVWAVKDALDWGKQQGRVWCIGDNRWEICG